MKTHDATFATMTAPPSPSDRTLPADGADPSEQPSAHDNRPIAPEQVRDRGRYRILGEHGRGGLGRVARAHDRELRRDVAIKELLSRNELREARFVREAMITARLEHPSIVAVHEAGRWDDGTPFYAMKLVSGRPLRDLIAERTTVAERITLLHHVIAVADAIAYAHGRHIIHRDLKPANVIVGDFGETVVIDWGLAKDISIFDDLPSGDPHGSHGSEIGVDLTMAGAVLGTPTYMAPEQERGEQVDQRADVFAIGAMLWELCSLQKVPPREGRQRHRMLKKAGIDPDLATIIDKALAPSPSLRYFDAGELAADLKAFKSGARITARTYSPIALISRWTRKHRALALTVAIGIVIAAAGTAFYIIHLAAERDLVRAAHDALSLKHAELLLVTDPTAAAAALESYRGDDTIRRAELLAEARGRGIAHEVVRPHNDTLWFLAEQPDGSIISLSEDRRLRRTYHGSTTTIASNSSYTVRTAYSRRSQRLAYMTTSGIAIVHLETLEVTDIDTGPQALMALSPDGTRLATVDKEGLLVVWELSVTPAAMYKTQVPHSRQIGFMTNCNLLVLTQNALKLVSLETATASTSISNAIMIDAGADIIAAGFNDGTISVLSAELAVVTSAPVCQQRVRAIQLASEQRLIVFGCGEGGAGIVRWGDGKPLRVTDRIKTEEQATKIAINEDGSGVLIGGGRIAYYYNINTQISTRLEGQGARVSVVAVSRRGANTPGHLLLGDVKGAIRSWDIPESNSHVVTRIPGSVFGMQLAPNGTDIAVYGSDSTVRVIDTNKEEVTEFKGHTGMIGGARFSSSGKQLLSFSWDGTARIWQLDTGDVLRAFSDHHSIVEDGDFIENGARGVSVGEDGHLYAWDTAGDTKTLLSHTSQLMSLEVLSSSNKIVVMDTAGTIWCVAPTGTTTTVRVADNAAGTVLRASLDGELLAVGQESGSVTVYRTSDWSVAMKYVTAGGIRRIAFDPMARDIAILSQDGFVHVLPLSKTRTIPWSKTPIDAHDIVYSTTGNILAVISRNSGIWFYSTANGSWYYSPNQSAEVSAGIFLRGDKKFFSADRNGTIISLDLSRFL